ncbi:MFS transporter [archaeon]|nr:MFS transporter [archaeon]
MTVNIMINEEKRKRSLKNSIWSGAFFSLMVGFGESFFGAFAVFLKANNFELSLLTTLPKTLGNISHIFSNKLLNLFKSRKHLISTLIIVQILLHIPIGLVYYFGKLQISFLIFFVTLYWICSQLILSPWTSWMGDVVHKEKRGSFFGIRNRISGLSSYVSFLLGGYILEHFSTSQIMEYYGFLILFLLAMIFRIVSLIFTLLQYEPKNSQFKEVNFNFIKFLSHANESNYGLFVLYISMMYFGVFICSAYFTPYLLIDLGFNYSLFAIISSASMIAKFSSMHIWGELCDNYGTMKVLALTGYIMPFVPLLWVFSSNVPYLIIIQLISGFLWGGFDMASFNFMYDVTNRKTRAVSVAYYNILIGILSFLGSMIGWVVVYFNSLPISSYLLTFVFSFVIRLMASLFFIQKLKEVRKVEKITGRGLLIKAFTIRPTSGFRYNLILYTFDFIKVSKIDVAV